MDRWEYLVVDVNQAIHKPNENKLNDVNKITEVLNLYGKDGWELVSVTEYQSHSGISVYYKAYFKRAIYLM